MQFTDLATPFVAGYEFVATSSVCYNSTAVATSSWIDVTAGTVPAIGSGAAVVAGDCGIPAFETGSSLGFVHTSNEEQNLFVTDRLGHFTLDGSLTTSQTVNLTPSSRLGNDVGVVIFVESGTAGSGVGGTRTLTITYTNQSGTSGRTATASLQAGLTKGSAVMATLQAGDTGVQSVQSAILSNLLGASTKSIIVLARILSIYSGPARASFLTRLHKVDGNTALCLYRYPSSTAAGSNSMFTSGNAIMLQSR